MIAGNSRDPSAFFAKRKPYLCDVHLIRPRVKIASENQRRPIPIRQRAAISETRDLKREQLAQKHRAFALRRESPDSLQV